MPERKRYRCLNCGNRFEEEVLSPEERRIAEREHRPLSSISCPDCHRQDLRAGWD